jgi:glycosyltransferase involved in cell wall biosynthesis
MAEQRPAVAIIMRTKDRPLLLDRAVADVCAQTFADWSLVIINDGGGSAGVDQVVRLHEPAFAGRVAVVHNADSRGMEAASNQGIKASASAYIAIHDDDDTWHPSFLERTVAHLNSTTDAAVAVRTAIVWEDVEGNEVTEQGREIYAPNIHSFTLFEMLRHNRHVPISVLYRREVHDEVGFFRDDLSAIGDWEFQLRLAVAAESLGFIDGEPLAFWHKRRETDGTLANSVIARGHDHRELDLMLRDEALRLYVRQHGPGALLYLTKYFQREIDNSQGRQDEMLRLLTLQNERLARLEAAISDASLVSLARRRYRRAKARFQRPKAAAGPTG